MLFESINIQHGLNVVIKLREEWLSLDEKFNHLSGVGSFNINDIKLHSFATDNIQRILDENKSRTQEIANSIAEQKQEEKLRKEKDSRNQGIIAQNTEEIKRLLSSMNQTLNMLVTKIEEEAELSNEQKREMNQLLYEIKDIMLSEEQEDKEKEGKMLEVMKKGLSVGGQASMTLFLEYLKYKAKLMGFPMN